MFTATTSGKLPQKNWKYAKPLHKYLSPPLPLLCTSARRDLPCVSHSMQTAFYRYSQILKYVVYEVWSRSTPFGPCWHHYRASVSVAYPQCSRLLRLKRGSVVVVFPFFRNLPDLYRIKWIALDHQVDGMEFYKLVFTDFTLDSGEETWKIVRSPLSSCTLFPSRPPFTSNTYLIVFVR